MDFSVFPQILSVLNFCSPNSRKKCINYYAVLTSPTKLKNLSGIRSTFSKKTWLLSDHKSNSCITFVWSHSGCYLRAWHHQARELISLFLFFLLWWLTMYSLSSSAIVLTSRPSPWTCTISCDSQNCYYLSWCQIDFFFHSMIVLWSCRVEITAGLCLDATPWELACASMSPTKRYIWILGDLSSGTFDLILIENPL